MKAARIRIESLAVIERFDRTGPTLVAVISSTSSNSNYSNSRCQPVDFSNYAHNTLTILWMRKIKRSTIEQKNANVKTFKYVASDFIRFVANVDGFYVQRGLNSSLVLNMQHDLIGH